MFADTVYPCVTVSERGFSAADGLSFDLQNKCRSGSVTVGGGGSAGSCTRAWSVLVAQMALPDVRGADVTDVALTFDTTQSSGGGLPVVLHGLGARTLDWARGRVDPANRNLFWTDAFRAGSPLSQEYGYPLDEADYYCGTTDPASNSVLINDAFAAAGQADGAVITENSASLTDYIRQQLDAATPGEQAYTALRFSPDSYGGCDTACDGGCSSKRVKFSAKSLT